MDRKLFLLSSVVFFKQKTAYEMLRSLVGSEMCIRDRSLLDYRHGVVTDIERIGQNVSDVRVGAPG